MLLSLLRNCLVLPFLMVGSLLSGCLSSDIPTTRFYVLDPFDSGVSLIKDAQQISPPSIEIVSLRLPQYLERPQIVTRRNGNQLELAEFHQWGGNLRKNMTRVLAKNLSRLLDTPDISVYPRDPQTPPDFRIELEVMRFERDPDWKVRLSTQWRLSRGKDRRPLITKIIELESPALHAGSDFNQTVSVMSGLMGELSKIIGQEILKHI